MPLFEIETKAHIIVTWAEQEDHAREQVDDNYPGEEIVRIGKRPRDIWVISKAALGISGNTDPSPVARDCLAKAAGDKVQAIRLLMQETGCDLEHARKIIESNMVTGW